MNITRQVIVDVDMGTDDYLGLLLLFSSSVQIRAIICSSGNISLINSCKNLMRLLELIGQPDIPVFKGACKPFIYPANKKFLFYGSNDFGGLKFNSEPNMTRISKEPAAIGIGEIILNNPDKISLICLGPLTNTALTLQLYEDFASSIKDIWIMGGSYAAIGNTLPASEFNFFLDPEAAYMVLNRFKKTTHILPFETCLQPQISLNWRFNVFGAKKSPALKLLTQAEEKIYSKQSKSNKKITWQTCDSFLVASFLYPKTLIKQITRVTKATVELHGYLTRGEMIANYPEQKDGKINIIKNVNTSLFKEILLFKL